MDQIKAKDLSRLFNRSPFMISNFLDPRSTLVVRIKEGSPGRSQNGWRAAVPTWTASLSCGGVCFEELISIMLSVESSWLWWVWRGAIKLWTGEISSNSNDDASRRRRTRAAEMTMVNTEWTKQRFFRLPIFFCKIATKKIRCFSHPSGKMKFQTFEFAGPLSLRGITENINWHRKIEKEVYDSLTFLGDEKQLWKNQSSQTDSTFWLVWKLIHIFWKNTFQILILCLRRHSTRIWSRTDPAYLSTTYHLSSFFVEREKAEIFESDCLFEWESHDCDDSPFLLTSQAGWGDRSLFEWKWNNTIKRIQLQTNTREWSRRDSERENDLSVSTFIHGTSTTTTGNAARSATTRTTATNNEVF